MRRKEERERKMEAELRFHMDQLAREKMAAGLPEEQARREAAIEFGGVEQIKEEVRDVHRIALVDTLTRNLRWSLRQMRRSPSFTLTVIATLTLGIGANTTVFSAIDAVLLRPLPFPRADDLVIIRQYQPKAKSPESAVAPQRLEDWNRRNQTFLAISGWYTQDVSELTGTLPEKVTEALVAPRFLEVWGVAPELGRDFSEKEEHFGGPNAVLISHRFWQRRFGGDSKAIGRQIRLEKAAYTIIGVLPASFAFPAKDADVWVPSPPDAPFAQSRDSTWFRVVGRLKPGVGVGQGRADLAHVQTDLGRQYPQTDAALAIKVEPLKETAVKEARASLWLLFGSVTVLLAMACVNVAAMLLARMTDRGREIAMRFSLGASRRTVVTQLLTECLALALPGGAAGLMVAIAGTRVLRTLTASLPRAAEVTVDWRIAAYTLACSLAVTLFCALLPALRATRDNMGTSLAAGGRTQVSSRAPWQWLLVGVQVSLAAVLLTGAGLLLRSFQELGRVHPGFDLHHILTLRISGNWGETTDRKKLNARVERTLDVMRNLPGVRAAATSAMLPGVPGGFAEELRVIERSSIGGRKIVANKRFVSEGYFATAGIPLLEGEGCGRTAVGAEGTALVNRAFARAYLEGAFIGQHLQFVATQSNSKARISGAVADAREQGLNQAPEPTVYWCVTAPTPNPFFLLRTAGDPMSLADTVRRRIGRLEPSRSVFDVSPLRSHLSDAAASDRLTTVLLSLFGATAVALVCVGLYGTLSYLVRVRRREIGLRLAIGATRQTIAGHFLAKGLWACVAGSAIGLPLAYLAAASFSTMLYGVSAFDVRTFAAVSALLLMAAALSALLPSIRAARLDPMKVLRDE